MREVTINAEQQLFVIPLNGGGYSCYGFDKLFGELGQLASYLGLPSPQAAERGTLEQYRQYSAALRALALKGGFPGTWYNAETPAEVKKVLEGLLQSRRKVRIYYGDIKTGRSWLDEYDMVGRIGRSTGLTKIPLLVPDHDDGGPGLLDACIVCIQDAATKAVLYQHPAFHVPELQVRNTPEDAEDYPKYAFEVVVAKPRPLEHSDDATAQVKDADWEVYARFPTEKKARHWIEFQQGLRMST